MCCLLPSFLNDIPLLTGPADWAVNQRSLAPRLPPHGTPEKGEPKPACVEVQVERQREVWARDMCAETARWKGRELKKSIQREGETRNWGLLRARTGEAISSYPLPGAEKASLLRPTKSHGEQKSPGQGLIRIPSIFWLQPLRMPDGTSCPWILKKPIFPPTNPSPWVPEPL